VTQLELSQPIAGPVGMRALADGRIILAENRSGKIDVITVEGNKAEVATIKDGFKFSPTAVTVVGDIAWVVEAKLAYRNDPALRTKIPDNLPRQLSGTDCSQPSSRRRVARHHWDRISGFLEVQPSQMMRETAASTGMSSRVTAPLAISSESSTTK
jgi:hypothetical protein